MFFADLKDKPEDVFKRLTGVRPATFLEMCQALQTHLSTRGRKPKHCLEDRLLLTLMYWREYRTYIHIGQTYGLSESAVCRTIATVEDALLRSRQFTLPGKKELYKKALTKTDTPFEVVVLDATECPLERPKKNSGVALAARKSVTLKKSKSLPKSTQNGSS